MRNGFRIGGLLVILAAAGCGSGKDQPAFDDLHPVKGVVKRGGKPVHGGILRFALDPEKPEFNTNAVVGDDGSYSLTTYRTTDKSGERKNGAPAGNYKVTYVPDVADQTTGGTQQPIHLAKPVKVNPGANEIPIDLPTAKK